MRWQRNKEHLFNLGTTQVSTKRNRSKKMCSAGTVSTWKKAEFFVPSQRAASSVSKLSPINKQQGEGERLQDPTSRHGYRHVGFAKLTIVENHDDEASR